MMLFSQGIFATIIDFVTWPPLQGIFTTIIDFVTWPPLQISSDGTKGGQVTKSIIVMKIPCENNIIYICKE